MINITVKLENDFDSKYQEINISFDEIKQLAAKKCENLYVDNYWNKIKPLDDFSINLK